MYIENIHGFCSFSGYGEPHRQLTGMKHVYLIRLDRDFEAIYMLTFLM